jgi:type II secretory pathway pseudopilin PulG
MAALLVSLAVMAVLMSVALPAWRHLARREKEAELAFRGEQYARAIALYRAKNGNVFPPSIDVLVQGHYLRKKYKDPMTPDGEFRLIPVGNPQAPQGGQRGGTPPAGRGGTPAPSQPGQTGSFVGGGIMGVASKSTETSIRIYKGQTRYDLWPFTFNLVNRPGGNMPNAGGPGLQPGQRGRGQGRGPGPGDGRGGPGRRGGGPGRGGTFIGPDGQPIRPMPMPPVPGGRGRGRGGGAPLSH